MEKMFNNILLPVRFEKHLEDVIENAVSFANRLECNLHIVYLFPKPIVQWVRFPRAIAQIKIRIQELQGKYYKKLKNGLLMFTSFIVGDNEKEIIRYALSHEIDLIFMGQEVKQFLRLKGNDKADRLASETNCAVFQSRRVHTPSNFG